MKREIRQTADGSHTIALSDMNVTYHSHHGALAESMHVFIDAGLREVFSRFKDDTIRILEIGFGTGLNALLSLREANNQQRSLHYTGIELFPLTIEEATRLNYGELTSLQESFLLLHKAAWEKDVPVSEYFILQKRNRTALDLSNIPSVHCIFLDAFAPTDQPELWTDDFFRRLFELLTPAGMLVTYCSKSSVRRSMQAVGFLVEKIPGPRGKREMLRAKKN